MKKFLLYLFRWQMSTPILYFVIFLLGAGMKETMIANLVGGCLFFYVDKTIFNK